MVKDLNKFLFHNHSHTVHINFSLPGVSSQESSQNKLWTLELIAGKMCISSNIISSLPSKQDWTEYEGIQIENPLKLYIFTLLKCEIYILS